MASSGKLTMSQLWKRLDPERMKKVYLATAEELGQRMVANLRAVTRKRTGTLAGGWAHRVIDEKTVEIRNPVRYAKPYDEGSIPHIIRPRPPKRAIAYKVAGGTVVRRFVRHPGTKKENVVKRGELRTVPPFMVYLRTKIVAAILEGTA